jgi:hypothetical protein
VGKLVVAFVLFLAASAAALHEARTAAPPPPPPEHVAMNGPRLERAADDAPPSRAIHDAVPPWVKYAAPRPATDEVRPPIDRPEQLVDAIDESDRCPDQPSGDDDGCPEPAVEPPTITLE